MSAVSPVPAHSQDGTWSSLSGASSPSVRREYAGVYDRDNKRYIIFGGFNGDYVNTYFLFNEVWTLSLEGTPTWTQLSIPGTVPGERHSPQWGYDPTRNRVLIFGGYGSHLPGAPYAYLDDVWELSLSGTPTWTEIHPTGTPPSGRLAGAAVYDPMRQRFIGFGGTVGTPVDTWILNLNDEASWDTTATDGTTPNGGYGMTSVYDAKEDRMIIFGGSVSAGYYGVNNNVYELRLRPETPQWNYIDTSGLPPVARRSGTAIFDPMRNRMVIFGGWDSTENGTASFLGDTWALSFDGQPTWTQLAPAGTVPTGRDAMSAAYDPVNDRMVVFGGWSGAQMLGDTQFLSWGETSSDAVLTADQVATTGSGGKAHVEWSVLDATGVNAAIYRRTPAGKWTSLATGQVSGGRLVYTDAAVTAGTTYDYMMVVGSERGETFGGQTQVQGLSPTGVGPQGPAVLGLRSVAPNPVVDRMTVSFTLASSQSAKLELLDVAGRHVLDREVGSLGAGPHQVDLGTRGTVPAGLYFLRLTQGGHSAATRVVVSGAR